MPRAADNKLTIRFVRMGQGDCTLIRCPTGELFIIDMGSSEREPIVGSDPLAYYDPVPKFTEIFAGYKTVDGLILTHPDKDHMNKVGYLQNLGATVKKVYFSDDFSKYNKGGGNTVGQGWMANVLIQFLCIKQIQVDGEDQEATDWANIRGVTYSDVAQSFSTYSEVQKTWATAPIPQGAGVDEYTVARGVKIHDRGGCTIHLLVASLVGDDDNNNNGGGQASRANKRQKTGVQNNFELKRSEDYYRNMRSIITLIEFKNKQYVICGDITGITAKFLLSQYADVKDVEIVQAPHHGSNTHDSSAQDFVQRMNPRILAISVGRETHQQPLPQELTIQRYMDNCPRLKKKEDDSDADEQTFGCYYFADPPRDQAHTYRKSWYYDPAVKMKGTIFLTGWHDLVFERT